MSDTDNTDDAGLQINNIEHLLQAGEDAGGVKARVMWIEHPDDPSVIIPVALEHQSDGESRVVVLDKAMSMLDARRGGPPRRVGIARLTEVDSFIAYLQRWGSTDTVIYADTAALLFTAVLNDHPTGGVNGDTAWRDHRAEYACPRSSEWKIWTKLDGKQMSQTEFADFIEERLEDLIGPANLAERLGPEVLADNGGYASMPTPLSVLAIGRSLHIKTKGTYSKEFDPTSGDHSLVLKSETETGSTVIPRAFLVSIPVFEGGNLVVMEARVKFTLTEGRPSFTYTLHRRAEIERAEFDEVRGRIADGASMAVLAGSP